MSSSPYMNNINSSSTTSASGGGGHHHNNSNHNSGSGGGQDFATDQQQLLLDGGAPGENHLQNDQHQMFLEDGCGPMAMALDDDNVDDSEEDTEEASETEMGSSSNNHRNADEPIEIKEQMYQDKLATLKKQLDELRSGTHPEYVRRVKKLEHQYSERIRLNEIYREYLINCVERDYILEKNAAVKEYEEKKIDLKENLMTDFEDRRKMIETERATMELTGDSVDVKPTITRKLRRRPNEPLPVPEKRRKPTTGQLVLLLDEKEVENDLKLISRGKAAQAMRNHQQQQQQANGSASGSSNSHSQMAAAAAAASNGTAQQSNSIASSTTPTPTPTPSLVSNSYQMNNSSNSSGSTSAAATAATPSTAVSSSDLTLALPQQQPPSAPAATSQPAASPAQPSNQQPPSSTTTTTTNGQQAPLPPPPTSTSQQQQQQNNQQPLVETRIEDGKLLYERRWFHRGQPVYVEGRDIQRFSANISAIGSEAIWVKKTSDGQKVRIFTNQLSRGKVSIKRRAN